MVQKLLTFWWGPRELRPGKCQKCEKVVKARLLVAEQCEAKWSVENNAESSKAESMQMIHRVL